MQTVNHRVKVIFNLLALSLIFTLAYSIFRRFVQSYSLAKANCYTNVGARKNIISQPGNLISQSVCVYIDGFL